MSKLSEISEYKNTVISRLLESKEIVKALNYEHENFLDQPDLDDASSLVYKNIFPHVFIPEIGTKRATYLTISCRKFKKSTKNPACKVGHLRLEVFTNKELFKTDYGVTRIDYITNKIEELFNSQRGIGVGGLEFFEFDELIINNQYMGAYLMYRSVDFN
ncbi:hypothetical protein ACFQZE_07365 [Paenibacillus sp. GCM10027627]|uniref:hypothetical protein n=1 Tax=unclassified Paenibacillus TaxID=185978 RepID=UPI003636F00B